MKKPSRVKILGQWIEIQHVDLSPEKEDAEILYGDSDLRARLIRIDINLDGAAFKRILNHEMYHMKLGISGLAETMPDNLEEALCILAETP